MTNHRGIIDLTFIELFMDTAEHRGNPVLKGLQPLRDRADLRPKAFSNDVEVALDFLGCFAIHRSRSSELNTGPAGC